MFVLHSFERVFFIMFLIVCSLSCSRTCAISHKFFFHVFERVLFRVCSFRIPLSACPSVCSFPSVLARVFSILLARSAAARSTSPSDPGLAGGLRLCSSVITFAYHCPSKVFLCMISRRKKTRRGFFFFSFCSPFLL